MPMQLQIITAEREVFSGEVDALVAPGLEGTTRHPAPARAADDYPPAGRVDGTVGAATSPIWPCPGGTWKCWATK